MGTELHCDGDQWEAFITRGWACVGGFVNFTETSLQVAKLQGEYSWSEGKIQNMNMFQWSSAKTNTLRLLACMCKHSWIGPLGVIHTEEPYVNRAMWLIPPEMNFFLWGLFTDIQPVAVLTHVSMLHTHTQRHSRNEQITFTSITVILKLLWTISKNKWLSTLCLLFKMRCVRPQSVCRKHKKKSTIKPEIHTSSVYITDSAR